jgi:flagellar biosynthesis protein FlhA
MAEAVAQLPLFGRLKANRELLFPLAVVSLLVVILVPLPLPLMDLLLVTNITISVVMLATTIFVKSPLEFAVLPSMLLAVTLFRLVLNVATTRLVLTAGDRADTPDEAIHAAGEMVMSFSQFVSSGSLAVGIIIFVIIFVIQFVVITKGATRISEVAARFTLDAMPGKQMAIDADLNAGTINETEARRRRDEIAQEADFYGAMDGASKFVRGDAIAGIVIVVINIVGGFYVGMFDNGWPALQVLELYTRLTIGDGLVSSVPAFIVSLAAGLIVTRSSSKKELGDEVAGQIFGKPQSLIVACMFLLVLSMTGLPTLPLLAVGLVCGGFALYASRKNRATAAAAQKLEQDKSVAHAKEPEKPESLIAVDAMSLEIGYGLVKLVDAKRGGDLLDRISNIRRRLAVELGIVVPPVRIRDDMQLAPTEYVIRIRNQAVGRGETLPEQLLAMDSGAATSPLANAVETREPAFGLPAYWISENQRAQAELLNYTVVEPSAVLATHLTEIVRRYAHELITRQEVKNLLETVKQKSPAVVEEVIPTVIKPGELQRVMQNLLRERVPVRDLETILETLGDYGTRTKDLDILTEYVRNALARTICKQHVDAEDRITCVTLDPAVEELIAGHLQRTDAGVTMSMPPRTQQQLIQAIAAKVNEAAQTGRNAVLLVGPNVRSWVRRMIEQALPQTPVLGMNEIVPEVSLDAVAVVGLNG